MRRDRASGVDGGRSTEIYRVANVPKRRQSTVMLVLLSSASRGENRRYLWGNQSRKLAAEDETHDYGQNFMQSV